MFYFHLPKVWWKQTWCKNTNQIEPHGLYVSIHMTSRPCFDLWLQVDPWRPFNYSWKLFPTSLCVSPPPRSQKLKFVKCLSWNLTHHNTHAKTHTYPCLNTIPSPCLGIRGSVTNHQVCLKRRVQLQCSRLLKWELAPYERGEGKWCKVRSEIWQSLVSTLNQTHD